MSKIKVMQLDDAQVYETSTVISRRLVRREHGSENMSFYISTLQEGYNDQNCVYADHDEIVYILSGKAELTIDGQTQIVSKDFAFYIPRGEPYGYKVVEGPNDMVVVFTPAKV